METLSAQKSHGGVQGVYRHASVSCACPMTFAVYVPPLPENKKAPVLWYLSGLTCTHANVMDKGEYRAAAAKHGIILVAPDTSPRGENVPDEPDNWQFGCGAGFYLDATQSPLLLITGWKATSLTIFLRWLQRIFRLIRCGQGIFGHSMGGHGALTLALKHPDRFKTCSAFAPITQPMTADWSRERWRSISAQMKRRGVPMMRRHSSTTASGFQNFWWTRER